MRGEQGRQAGTSSSGHYTTLHGWLLLWGPALLWMLVIFVMSAQSALGGMEGPPLFQAARKSGHIFEYAILALLIGRALAGTWTPPQSNPTRAVLLRAWRFGVLACALYALTDEYHQTFVPRRGGHIEDAILDTLAATAALGIAYIWRTRIKANSTHSEQPSKARSGPLKLERPKRP